jgi:hypothetical protein
VSTGRTRVLIALSIANLVLVGVALGWLAWMSASPRYWFRDAYAQKGDRGDPGPRGPVGPAGPPGPVGPDAQTAIDDLDARLADVEDSVSTLQSDLSDLEDKSGFSTLETDVQDTTSKLNDVCDAFANYSGAFEEIYLSAC